MKKINHLIVGCGISGIVIAEQIATKLKEKVLIIEKRKHIGGNCYDYEKDGILIQKYGPHIFHTQEKYVWEYLSQFTKWYYYRHKVNAKIDKKDINLPFNINSLYALFEYQDAKRYEDILKRHFSTSFASISELLSHENIDIKELASIIFSKIFYGYSLKQWGQDPNTLSKNILSRLPIRLTKDDDYFSDKYQGIPLEGYTKMFERMLDNPLIEIKLGTNYNDIKHNVDFDHLFYTGSLDELFDYQNGILPYRSLKIKFQKILKKEVQKVACVNYPNHFKFTRITEYKKFLDTKADYSIISKEYPNKFIKDKNERFYPINTEENNSMYKKYKEKIIENKIHLLGRLGDYKYYDMDKAVLRALQLFKEVYHERL